MHRRSIQDGGVLVQRGGEEREGGEGHGVGDGQSLDAANLYPGAGLVIEASERPT